jgi:hypothetical protein
MLRLCLIVQNPAATSAITWIGMVIVALSAAVIVALWVFLARRTVHPDDGVDDPGLEVLRHRRLVVLPARKARGQQAAVLSELDPTSESEPTAQ